MTKPEIIITGNTAGDMTWRDVYPKEDIPYCDIITNYTEIMQTTRMVQARQKEQDLRLMLPPPSDFLNEGIESTAIMFSLLSLFAHGPPQCEAPDTQSTLENLPKPFVQSMLSRKNHLY